MVQGGLMDLLEAGVVLRRYSEPQGTIEYFDENGVLIDKGSGEYNRHGNDSWAYDQSGFDYIMRDQFGYNYALQDQVFKQKIEINFKD